jgi:[acyl-carrier-protein] S-malonyltransferase
VLGLLFPGQGSQRPQMGVPWQDHRAWSEVAGLSEATGRDVASLLVRADAETLRATRNAQLAAYALSLVVLRAARSSSLAEATVAAVAGHSLGEYTALVAAQALDPMVGARLVAARGDAMQTAADAAPGTMAAVLGLDPDLVAQACDGVDGAWPANDNAPGQVVIAGTAAGIEKAGEAAKALGAKRILPLPVGGAFHSPLMAPAQAGLDAALAQAAFGEATVDVVANVDAGVHREGWAALLSRQLQSPVCWRQSLQTLAGLGVTHYLELGPGTELSGMVKRTIDPSERVSVATPEDLEQLAGFLEGSRSSG